MPGAVLYLQIIFPEVTKNKFVVLVASSSPNVFNFIINSETNHYIEERPYLNVCQVTIDEANHNFLQRDSQIACHEILSIPRDEIIQALMEDFGRYKGTISVDVKDDIVAAVKHATTLSVYEQTEIIQSLDDEYLTDKTGT